MRYNISIKKNRSDFNNEGMLSVNIIIIQDKNMWGIRSSDQHTNIVSRGNRKGSWKWIICILGYFGGWGISSMVMDMRFRYGLTPSTEKLLLKES